MHVKRFIATAMYFEREVPRRRPGMAAAPSKMPEKAAPIKVVLETSTRSSTG